MASLFGSDSEHDENLTYAVRKPAQSYDQCLLHHNNAIFSSWQVIRVFVEVLGKHHQNEVRLEHSLLFSPINFTTVVMKPCLASTD